MFKDKKLLKELEQLINGSIDPSLFPYAKGKSIRIGQYVVRENKKGFFLIYDLTTNAQIARTFCKSSAVALAKSLSQGKTSQRDILEIDKEIQKWYNDCVFYKYTMRVTTDEVKHDITSTRYEIAKDKTRHAKDRLDKYIYA